MADDLSDAGLNLSDLTDAMNNPAGVNLSQLAGSLGVDPSQLQSVLTSSDSGDASSQPLVPVGANLASSGGGLTSMVPDAAKKNLHKLAHVASQIISAVGFTGFAAVATALGIDPAKALQAWLGNKGGKRRRRRGISARDMSTTRRTIRKVSGMYHNLEHSFPRHRSATVVYRKKK
jgi:hypothetical protein